jgi:hypothetical protein
MNLKSWIMPLALVVCTSAFADDAKITNAAIEQAAAEVADDAQVPEQNPDEVKPTTPTAEELAARLEGLGEAMTEARNSLEALNRLRVSGYILAQYVNDESSINELSGAAATRNKDQFSVREARVKFTYQFSPTSRFVLQPEVASSGVSLKDGFVEFTEPWSTWHHTLTAGQFNWPFGFEIAYSSSLRELPERSRVIRTLFPSERDRGIQLSGAGFAERFKYEVGFVNGTGTLQTFDFNKRKDFIGHVRYALGPLDLGASLYRGAELVATSTNAKGIEFSKNRIGADFQWITPIQGLGIRGEYIAGTQPPAPGSARTESPDVDGWYLYAIQSIGTHHQFAVRLDQYDPNTGTSGDATRTLGASYIFHWDANSKMMFAYEHPKTQGADPDDNVFTARYAFVF